MNNAINNMLQNYQVKTIEDEKNVMKEIMQEIVLCGLSRAGFFNKAAFYGGSALRIFYGLDRFSEDLDFSLMVEDQNFNLESYFPTLIKEVRAYGLNVEIQNKEKKNKSNIKSAFLKGGTKEHLLLFYPNKKIENVSAGELIKIKFEIDVNPPMFANYERKYRMLPIPYEVNLYDEPSLFAGKIHAVICRSWKSRVKGRDLYDYIFYLSRNTPVNLMHLKARLVQTGFISETDKMNINDVKNILKKRFENIDYANAKMDVYPFIKNQTALDVWEKEFFKSITENLKGC